MRRFYMHRIPIVIMYRPTTDKGQMLYVICKGTCKSDINFQWLNYQSLELFALVPAILSHQGLNEFRSYQDTEGMVIKGSVQLTHLCLVSHERDIWQTV